MKPAVRPPLEIALGEWRHRRGMSQLDLALEAEISQKHLSFIESGRSIPSRDMVVRLAAALGVPLRERNAMLLAAGFAPIYLSRALDDPALAPARAAINLLLRSHAPFPALAVDRHWTMVAANRTVETLLSVVAEKRLLEPPVNVLRISLHPGGLAPMIANHLEWRDHLCSRLRQQIAATGDSILTALLEELRTYPVPGQDKGPQSLSGAGDVFVPLILALPMGRFSFFSTTTGFGTPVDVTLSEIAIEAFFPADDTTRDLLQPMAVTA